MRQRVTTCPGTGQVATTPGASCNIHDWIILTCWNIQMRLQHIQNNNFDTQIDQFGQLDPALKCKMRLFVPILENGRILDF